MSLGLELKLKFETVFKGYQLDYKYHSNPYGLFLRIKISYNGLDYWRELRDMTTWHESLNYDLHMPRSSYQKDYYNQWAWQEISTSWINHRLKEGGFE